MLHEVDEEMNQVHIPKLMDAHFKDNGRYLKYFAIQYFFHFVKCVTCNFFNVISE